MRLVDLDELIDVMSGDYFEEWEVMVGEESVLEYTLVRAIPVDKLEAYPTIEIKDECTVTRAKWIGTEIELANGTTKTFRCNRCRMLSLYKSDYCPHCGSAMED